MSASFVAGFWMVVITFIMAAVNTMGHLTGDTLLDVFILIVIFANIIFFYAFGLIAEQDQVYHSFIRGRGNAEWYLRVLSNVLLLAIPIGLEHGVEVFSPILLLFYISLLAWDAVVFWRAPRAVGASAGAAFADRVGGSPPSPVLYDVLGLLLAAFLWGDLAMYPEARAAGGPKGNNLEYQAFALGVIAACFGAIAAGSISKTWPTLNVMLSKEKV